MNGSGTTAEQEVPAANPSGGLFPGCRWIGLLCPGLGHILAGRILDGIGFLSLLGVCVWALWGGAQGYAQFEPLRSPKFSAHPWIALGALILWPCLLWWRAIAFALRGGRDIRLQKKQEGVSQWTLIRRRFVRNRAGVLGGYLVLVLILLALITPMITPYNPLLIDVGGQLSAPGWRHLMGTDEFRRDIFSRVMYGARISLAIGFIAVSISATLGTAIGAISGYFGGLVDQALMWVTDLLLSLPRLVLLLAIIGFFRAAGAQSLFLIVVVLGLTGWMGVARIVRSQVLSLKEQAFIQAARGMGLPTRILLLRHLIPNCLAPVIVYGSLAIGSTILVEASLSFLGLGVPPPTPTWGNIVNDGREYLRSAWWITMFPGGMIVFAVMSFNLLGDGLRDAMDPKTRQTGGG